MTEVKGHKEMAMSPEEIVKDLGVLPSVFMCLGSKEKGLLISTLDQEQAFQLGQIIGYRRGLENGFQASANACASEAGVLNKLKQARLAGYDFMWHFVRGK